MKLKFHFIIIVVLQIRDPAYLYTHVLATATNPILVVLHRLICPTHYYLRTFALAISP